MSMIIQHVNKLNISSSFQEKNTASVLGENFLSSKILKAKIEKIRFNDFMVFQEGW